MQNNNKRILFLLFINNQPTNQKKKIKKNPLATGFEPVRAEPIAFRVQRLNLSAKPAKSDNSRSFFITYKN